MKRTAKKLAIRTTSTLAGGCCPGTSAHWRGRHACSTI